MLMKLWEAEFFAVNFQTGVTERIVSTHYFSGVNFEQAQLSLVRANMPWLRLTGNWFSDLQAINDYNNFYEIVKDPKNIVEGMDYDDFMDWLELGDKDDIEAAIVEFEKAGLTEHVKVMKAHLKINYGESEENNTEEGEEDSPVEES